MQTCRCDPTHGQDCPACDGTLAELEPWETGEACIAFEEPPVLCAHRAEPGSDFCVEHSQLDADLPTIGAAA